MQNDRPELKRITKGVLVATLASVLTSGFINTESRALGMQNFVNGMFTASSMGSATSNGNGVTYSGGYYEVRTPLSGANVISFTPPNISAGCGGVNLFFGSFHFINGQQFMALLRQIGQQALGYAFQLAIDAMCHQCGALLAMIEKDIQNMNNALKNTCQLAKGIFNGADLGNIAQVVNQSRTLMSSAVGDVSGFFKGSEPSMSSTITADENGIKTNWNKLMNSVSNTGAQTQTTVPVTTTQAQSLPQFNMFWKAINASDNQDLLANLNTNYTTSTASNVATPANSNACQNTGETSNACTKEILMSLVGTLVIQPGETSNASNASSGAAQGSTSNMASGNINSGRLYGGILSLNSLVNGTPNAQVYECANVSVSGAFYNTFGPVTGCMGQMGETTLGSMGYVGIKQMVQGYLLGGNVGGVSHQGLAYDMDNGITPSAATLAFEKDLPYGTQTILQDAETGNQNNPGTGLVMTVANLLEPMVVDQMAVKFGEASLNAVEVYNGQHHIIIPPMYKSYLGQVVSEIETYEKNEASTAKNLRLAEEIVQSARVKTANTAGSKL